MQECIRNERIKKVTKVKNKKTNRLKQVQIMDAIAKHIRKQ